MHLLYGLQEGGTEYGVIKLVNGLDPRQVASSICSTTPATAIKLLLRSGVRLHECARRTGNDPKLVWDLFRLFRRERPDIVHTHAWGTLIEGWLAARLARVPVVIHGEHGTLQSKPYQLRVQRHVWGRVDKVLSVSSRLADKLAAATGFPRSRLHVIRNGVDLARFTSVDRAAARQSLGIPESALVIGTAGRLVAVKDQASLLDALSLLASQGTRFEALLAGEGPLQGELEAKARALGLANCVRFLGHQPEIERVFAAMDIFVLSSKSEGLSNTILEAMASGLPVVATNVGGADELVEDSRTGLLVKPESAADLAAGIAAFSADCARRRAAGDAGRRRALTEFGIQNMVNAYRDVYCRMASGLQPDARLNTRLA